MMTLIIALIKSLQLYLELKNKLFYYEIREKSKKRQNEIVSEIEKLRNAGDSNSSDAADLLRSQLKLERKELEHLSAFYSKTEEKSAN